jgi:hypothetical protein
MKKVVRLILVVTFVVFSTISLLYSPVIAGIKQLTDNDYNESSPHINDVGEVVWHGSDGDGYELEIFLYTTSSGGISGNGGCLIGVAAFE